MTEGDIEGGGRVGQAKGISAGEMSGGSMFPAFPQGGGCEVEAMYYRAGAPDVTGASLHSFWPIVKDGAGSTADFQHPVSFFQPGKLEEIMTDAGCPACLLYIARMEVVFCHRRCKALFRCLAPAVGI